MTLKIILCVLIIAFGVAVGYFMAGKYRSRAAFYSDFCLFHERYLSELQYTKSSLREFIAKFDYKSDFAKVLAAFPEVRGVKKLSFLKDEEEKALQSYFEMLGRGDSASQRSYFSSQTAELNAKREASEREKKVKGDLYLKLGLLAGLAVVVLIV